MYGYFRIVCATRLPPAICPRTPPLYAETASRRIRRWPASAIRSPSGRRMPSAGDASAGTRLLRKGGNGAPEKGAVARPSSPNRGRLHPGCPSCDTALRQARLLRVGRRTTVAVARTFEPRRHMTTRVTGPANHSPAKYAAALWRGTLSGGEMEPMGPGREPCRARSRAPTASFLAGPCSLCLLAQARAQGRLRFRARLLTLLLPCSMPPCPRAGVAKGGPVGGLPAPICQLVINGRIPPPEWSGGIGGRAPESSREPLPNPPPNRRSQPHGANQ